MELPQEKLQQIQILEQNLQTISQQKQSLKAQTLEIESALKELNSTNQAFKIVGNIMVASNKEKLIEDLKSQKEIFDVRTNKITSQEKEVTEKYHALSKELSEIAKKEK